MYNLNPILNLLSGTVPNSQVWKERLTSFFNNDEYDPKLQDQYYDGLIKNVYEVEQLLKNGTVIDQYTGLFSFPSPYIEASHSFNIAHFISRNYQHFYGKNILTVCHDYGILNVQLKLCGLNLVSSIQKPYFQTGTILTCIGNNAPPYPINEFLFEEEDIIIMSCVFEDGDLSFKNWEYMVNKRLDGKDVFLF